MTNKKNNKSEISQLAQILSGEYELLKQQEKIKKLKKDAIDRQKSLVREGIKEGNIKLLDNYEDAIDNEKEQHVIQNITLYEWEAPIRIANHFDQKQFAILAFASMLFILYLAVLGNYALMLAIIALLFFIYVSGTTKPDIIKNKITARGIDTLDKVYDWYMLENFRFTVKNRQHLLIVETKLRYPSRLILLLKKEEREPLFLLLQDKVLYKDIRKQSKLDLWTFGKYIPLEKI
ncbi:hypothetical protein H6764_02875 [Candidatus Nomurabacteria bacterium]|nr:hypothetical protein [Candidatus Nomurabacteria bacterium]